MLELTLHNENTLDYVLWGREIPGGWVWERLAGLHARWSGAGADRQVRASQAK